MREARTLWQGAAYGGMSWGLALGTARARSCKICGQHSRISLSGALEASEAGAVWGKSAAGDVPAVAEARAPTTERLKTMPT